MPVEITPFRPEDEPRWAELWRGYLAFYGTTLPADTYRSTWARLLDGTALHGLAARSGSGIVGLTHFLFHGSAWATTPVCYLQDLFVDPAARGSGVGQALIAAVAAQARTQGCSRLYWLTQADNAAARRLYDRVARHSGFIRYELALG